MTTLGTADRLGPQPPDIPDPASAVSSAIAPSSLDMSAQSEILNATEPYTSDGYFKSSHASYSSHTPGSKSSSVSSEEDVPLSMRFMHKPSRSGDQFRKASDPTRRNSIANAHIDDTSPAPPHHPDSASSSRRASMDGYRLVRKKSGEIVKSSLKEGTSRSKSLPSTPSFKSVHFGGDADIRYFSKKDRPTAISASNSPALVPDSDDDEQSQEFQYFDDELNSHVDPHRSSAAITKYPTPHHGRLIDWDVKVINFPSTSLHDRISAIRPPVFLERVFVSIDKRFLLGHIAVSNIAYEKTVTVRYTLDKWATIVEIPTIYVPDIPVSLRKNNYDRFVFKIPLDSMFNSFHTRDNSDSFTREHSKSYHLCIRYSVPGHEFWDNNGGRDYSIKIKKTIRSSEQSAGPDFVADDKKQTPRLRGGGVVPPKMARSKPEAHSQRPKYSSHYLKRFNSEPNLKASDPKDKPAEKNDFESNGFYLSSPLFSSIKNNRGDALYDDQDNLKGHSGHRYSHKTLNSDKKNKHHSQHPQHFNSIATDSTLVADEPSPMEGVVPSHQLHDEPSVRLSDNISSPINSKSYKELLESYCFFTSPSSEASTDATSTTLSQLDPKQVGPERCSDNDSAFTVSSFLRK
ncbi:hypothetical protein CA3LBN_001020 [Candidozyma haemuli]|uniref:CBM21 domain-containing protein n=1 Tax=Candidozyma haemuli TaxID=45357 RepID=A0ABX8I495_9ASCO|nr:hypothetical protein CA3LBN_001020 [[Candida] haemuloni]